MCIFVTNLDDIRLMHNRLRAYKTTIVSRICLLVMAMMATMMIAARETAHIHEQNGLMGDNVQEVYTDSRGLTWVGTNEGVCCYNGVDIVYFEPEEAGPHRSVAHVAELPNGDIVLGTRGGLCRINFKRKSYTIVDANVGIVNALCLVNDTLIIGSRNGLWVYHTDKHIERIALEGTVVSRENAINAMVTDGVSGVWICTNQRLMHVTFPTRIITKYDIAPSLLNGNIRTLCRIGNTLYIGPHTGALFSFNCTTESFLPCPHFALENIVNLSTEGTSLYVATNGNGSYRIDTEKECIAEHWHTEAEEHTLPDNMVNHFTHDPSLGINWWGLYPSGLIHERHERPLFSTYQYGPFDSRKHSIRCFCIQGDERLIGTSDGIWYIDETLGVVRHIDRKQFGDNNINDIAYFGGRYLIAGKGIMVYDPLSDTLKPISEDEAVTYGIFNHFCSIKENTELLASSDLGLVMIDANLQIKQVFTPFNSRLPESYPVDICSDGAGKTWIGTTLQLCMLNEHTGHIQTEGFPTDFFDRALSLHFSAASDGDVIAYTEKDIYKCKVDLSSYQHYDMNKLAGAVVTTIIPYKDGYWVGTNTGLLLCDANFVPVARYDKSDGLHHLKVTGREHTYTPDGSLWIALERGIARLTPEGQKQLHQPKKSKIAIRELKVGGHELDETASINLLRNEESIRIKWNFMSESLAIEPILLDYAEQRGRIYEWKIGNGEYRSTKGKALLNIGALRPGRHTLQIRLLGHEETASQYTLLIIPSGTFWLEIALAVAIICIGIISYKYRRRKEQLGKLLRQKHQLELRIAAEQAVEAHKQEEHRRITAQEEERRQALQERTQRSSELHRTLEQQIRTYLTETKAYRNPSLKVADVATAVGTSTTNVSEMCSMHLEVSFFSLINGYRFDEFKRIVRDEQYANYTITALAEMCGFKKSSFFNVFKEHEGCTPAAWLKREGIKRE